MPYTSTGAIRLHKAFTSRFVDVSRDIAVYLPPDYDSSPGRRYPVLYLHDGQNLFDAATAFLGNEWGLDEVADDLIRTGQIEPLIIAGIYNTGEKRLAEYTPVRDRRGRGGRAQAYGRMIVEELKPFIDSRYRTLPDVQYTGLGGSSLGGLVTLYLGMKYPALFGKLIVMSPAVWWANRAILKEVRKLPRKFGQKIWLDIGTCEGSNPELVVNQAIELKDALIEKGWELGVDLAFMQDEGAAHNEKAWGQRIRYALQFLFPLR
ncbi:MAG: alpha/beta hydrolase [Acidobacteriaceae bacterium]|nr:alpha/beta hydrolase [Acidobacteriaceae bacterium]